MTMNKIEIRKLPQGQRAFDALPMEERSAIVERSEVKEFLHPAAQHEGSGA